MKIKINSGDRSTTLSGSRYELTQDGTLIVYSPEDVSVKAGEFRAWTEYEVLSE